MSRISRKQSAAHHFRAQTDTINELAFVCPQFSCGRILPLKKQSDRPMVRQQPGAKFRKFEMSSFLYAALNDDSIS